MKRYHRTRHTFIRFLFSLVLFVAGTLSASAQDAFPGTLLDFDGADDYMIVPDSDNLDLTSYTLETWVRLDAVKPDWQPIIIKENQNLGVDQRNYGLWIKPNTQKLHYAMAESDCSTGHSFDAVGDLSLGEWHHVAVTYGGQNFKLYIDGKLDSTHPLTITPCQGTGPVMFGWGGVIYSPLDGALEESRIWNKARSQTEIRDAMHLTLSGAEPGLVAYWQYNEGSGTTAADVVGGNDGLLVNGTPWAASDVPVAGGTSVTQTEADGMVDFSAAGVTMNYSSQNGASVTVTRLDSAPSALPGTLVTPFDQQYWAVERFGTGSFDVDATFTVSEDLTSADAADPGRIKLFTRASTAGDEPWGVAASAASVDAAANTATFTGLTSFSQFLIGRSGTPDPSAGTLLDFDGTDDQAFAQTDLDLGATDITVEAWVQRASSGTTDFFFSYGDVNEGVNQGLSMGFRPTNVFAFGFAGGNDLDTPDTYTDTEWHHWAGVYDRANATRVIYRDGVEVASDAGVVPFEEVANPELYLGRFFLQDGSDFGGEIEELRIWSVARTETEIREGMHRTMTGSETGLVAYWQFNEGTGTTASDVVGGHDVALQNGTAWDASDVPIAGGTSVTQTEADGMVDFSAAGVTMDYTTQSGASVTVTRLDSAPSSLPTGSNIASVLDSQYWTFERFGTGAFDVDVTFTVSEDLSADVPERIALFRRDSQSGSGVPWERVEAASMLDSGAGTVTFPGLSAFSQFILVRTPEPDPFAGTLLTFDGNGDFAEIPHEYSFAGDFSVAAWFRTTMDGIGKLVSYYECGINCPSGEAPNGVLLYITSGQATFYVRDKNNVDDNVASTMTYNDGVWHQMVGVREAGFLKLYVDGAQVGSVATTTGLIEDRDGELDPWLLGAQFQVNSSGKQEYLNGDLDEVSIWNVARTASDVQAGLHHPLSGGEPGLVSYWQLNEGAGTNAADIVGGQIATLNGDAAWNTSFVPIEAAVSVSQTEANGMVDFPGTGVTMNYTAQNGASVVVSRFDATPPTVPGTLVTSFDQQYWAVERFGTGGFDVDATFTVNEDLTAADAADPGRIKLFTRASTASDEPWGVAASAASVDAAANTATFTGLTSFSQFLIGRSGTPDPSAGTLLDFDGIDDYAVVPDNDGLDLTSYTLETWVRLDAVKPDWQPIIIKENQNLTVDQRNYGLWIIPNTQKLHYAMAESDCSTGHSFDAVGDLSLGEWHHVATTYDGANFNLYIDGNLDSSQPLTITPCQGTGPVMFGWGGVTYSPLDGALEESRIWNMARTETELREGMHRTMSGSETGLVAYWQFNEATGTTAQDVAGGQDAALIGGTAWAASDVPVAGGASVTQTEADGLVDFSAAGVTMDYTSQNGASVTVTRLDDAPSSLPEGGSVETVFDGQYWVFDRVGTGSFNTDVTFTVSEDLSGDTAGRLLLFRRDSRAGSSVPWEQVGAADSLDATAKTITFRGLTAFSQFILVRAPAAQTVPGSLISLDGVDDYVEIPDGPAFAFDTDSSYTAETWVRYSGTGGPSVNDGSILEKWSDGPNGYPFVIRHVRATPGQVYCAAWDQSTNPKSVSNRTNLNDGQWHHLACAHDGVNHTLTLYVDGEPQPDVSTAGMGMTKNTDPIFLGRRGTATQEWFGGDLEETRIWRVARTPTEIRGAMHRTMTGAEPGLVAYWQFNEGSGTTAFDIVGGNDGTLNGGTAWASSDTPVGGGVSASATAAVGTVAFPGTDLSMDFSTNTTNDPLTVTRLDLDPNEVPAGTALTVLGSQYWVVDRFGDGAFDVGLTITVPGLTSADETSPERLKLLRRDSRAAGGTWSVAAHGVTVDAGAGTVTFSDVATFSQFVVARGGIPGTLAGNAASFNFTYADVGDLGDFGQRLQHATTSFWMMSSATSSGSIMKVDVDPGSPTAPVFSIEANRILSTGCAIGDGAGATTFFVRDNAGKALARYITDDLYDGAWHHVAWVIEDAAANLMTVYIDGVPATLNGTCSQAPGTFVAWQQPLYMGAADNGGTADDAVPVNLDEVRLFTTARTAEEIRARQHGALTGDEEGLVAYWQMDEADGAATAIDVVGGHDGTFSSTASNHITATEPLGPGEFAFDTERSGAVTYGATGLTADYLSQSASGTGLTRIDVTPFNPPAGASITLLDSTYHVMERYDGGPFSANLTFETAGLTSADETDPSRIKLFRRAANVDGEWLVATSASAVDAAAGTVTFPAVSKSGQFAVARGASTPAVAGTALDFNGTDAYVRLPGLVVPNTFTLEMWINPQSATDGRSFFAKDTGNDGSGFGSEDLFNIGFYEGKLRVFLRFQKMFAGDQVTGQQHLAFVVQQSGSSSIVTVYRDGVQIAQQTMAAVLDDDGSGSDWVLGQNWVLQALAKALTDPPAGDFFDGSMDEIRLWNEARTDDQIRTDMHAVFGGTVDGLLGYWLLNEGAGLVATDLVAGHDGTLEGGTAWAPSGAVAGAAVTGNRMEENGVVAFAGTDFQLDYASQNGADVYVTHIDGSPNQLPACVTTAFDGQYWALERFGTGTFSADLTLTPSETLDDLDQILAGRIKLFYRSGSSDGTWTPAAEAGSVNPFTGDVTFRHIALPGQYMLARSDAAALTLDGVDQYASSPNTEPLDSWTLEAWVNAAAAPSDTLTTAIVARGPDYALYWDHPDSTARAAAALTIGGTRYTASFGTLTGGRWYHLAASYDGETLRSYVNGKLVTENDAPSGAPDDDGSAVMFGRDAASGGLFTGTIDEVRLWDVFRNDDKILADLQHTLSGDETGLAGYWRFDANVNGAARDLGDRGLDAAFVGFPALTASDVPADLVFPGDVVASDAAFEDRTEISWDAINVEDVTVAIQRDATQISVAASGETMYSDFNGTRGTTHTYCLVLSSPLRGSSDPVCDDGSRILFAPENVAATDSTLDQEVKITWTDRSFFESGFNIYRDGGLLTTLGPDAQVYSDTSVVGGMTHTYCVEAEDSDGIVSAQGCDDGSRGFVLPPLDVSATDGQYADRVKLTWTDQAPDETGYRILRDTVEIGTVPPDTTSFEDLAPVTGVTYSYCVVTQNNALESVPVCDDGGIDILPAPGDVTATVNTFDDRVEVSWSDPVDFEDGFRVYRHDLTASDSTLLTTTSAGAQAYTDTGATPGVDYRYCATTLSTASGSDVESASSCTMGRRSEVLAPIDMAATDDENEDRVVLTWTNPATRAVLMNVYRIDADTTLLKTITSALSTYDDFEQASGVTYTYCVAAVNEDAFESALDCDEGSRKLLAPTDVAAKDGESEDFVEVTWVDNSEIEQGYRIYRQSAAESFQALVGTTGASQASFQDFNGTSGITYTYSVVAFDAYSESEADTDDGIRTLAAPTNVTATDVDFEDKIAVTWFDNSRAEDGYRVYRRLPTAEDSTLVGTTDKNLGAFEDATAELGQAYVYSVIAFDDYGASASDTDAGSTVLFAPETFNASDTYAARVVMSWIDQSAVEDGYQVLRDGVLIATTAANVTAYIDSTTAPDMTHNYCVRAFGGIAFSDEPCDDGIAMTPGGIQTIGADSVAASNGQFDTRVQITWSTASVDGSQGFSVLRDGVQIDVTGAGASVYNDFDVPPGGLSLYCVNAVATSLEVGCDYGWVPSDGSISGRVASQLGGGIGDVQVCLDPNPNKALLFDGEGGYAPVQEVTLPTAFTVEMWVRPVALTGTQDLIVLPDAAVRLGLTGAKLRATLGGTDQLSADLLTTDWQHLALVVDQDTSAGTSSVQLFRDGIAAIAPATISAIFPTTPERWIFGGDTLNTAYFSGRMDEVRLWSRALTVDELQQSAQDALPLNGDEADLVAYWPMDQGAGTIAGDRSGGNAHAAFAGGVYWTDESAPLAACAVTDNEGNYTVEDLRYGTGTTFKVTPNLGARQFDPGVKNIALSSNSPVQNEVDFTDVSAFTISGIVQAEGTTCPVPEAQIFLDGSFKGQTEADGTYNIAADIGERTVEIKKGDAGDEHSFTPASLQVTVEDNVSGMDFTDSKTRELSGFFGGSCNTSIGTATIKIFTADGCFEKEIQTSSNYSIDLPPQKYFVQVTDVETTNAQLKADIIEFFDMLGAQEVDLTEKADTLDLIYHAPLSVSIAGFLDAPASLVKDGEALCPAGISKPDGGSIEPVPVLIQPNGEPGYIPLTISVFEDFGDDGLCPADSGTVTIFDEIDNMGDTPVELSIDENGIAVYADDQIDAITGDTLFVAGELYRTRANSPNIAAGRTVDGVDRSFQKSLTAVAEVKGRLPVTETAWVLVDGALARTSTFATEPIDLPFYVLRDPPGDGSYSYLEKGSNFCTTTNVAAFFDVETEVEKKVVTGVRFTKGLGISFLTKAQVGAKVTTTLEIGTKVGGGITYCTSTTEQYKTSSDGAFVGSAADVLIGAGVNFDFSPTDVIAFDDAACKISKDEDISVDLNEDNTWKTTYSYTQDHIRNTLIPDLDAAIADVENDDDKDRLTTAKDNWNEYLDENQNDKEDAQPIDQDLSKGTLDNISFTSGADFGFSYAERTGGEGTLEFELSHKTEAEVLVFIGESGFLSEPKLKITTKFGGSISETLSGEESTTRGFVLADDDIGDVFSVDVKQGKTWDTPIFELKSGTSSGPWEEGTQRRDNPTLSLNPPELLDVPADQPAVFTLSLTNLSESKEAREYVLRTVSTSNPGGGTLKAQGSSIQSGLSFVVDPDQTQEITLEVSRGPTKYKYDDLAVMVYPPGDYTVSDTVFFNVHYIAPCSDIAILRPKENWLFDATMAAAGDSVEVILNDFALGNADADSVQTIGLDYRPKDTPDWLPALQVQASTLDPDADSYVAKWLPPVDGLYDVRAFAACPLGTTYSDPFPGTADTKRPVALGSPQPSDGALALGDEIAITFDEDIDCGTVSTSGQYPDVSLTYLDGPDTGMTIPVEAVCDGRSIVLDPQTDDATLEGRFLEATLLSGVVDGQGNPVVVSDAVGNGIENDIAWRFTARQSAFTFSPVNVDMDLTRGTGIVVSTSLVNGREQPVDYTLPDTLALTIQHSGVPGDTTVVLTPSVTAGTLVAGGTKTVAFTLPDTLALGTYQGVILASGTESGGASLGATPFTLTTNVVCSPPAWTVTPSNFQYSMSLTGQVFFNGVASADSSDVLAAIVDGQVRGVAKVVESTPGIFRLNMLIYSNQASGEIVTFHAWDNSTCSLFEETGKTLAFESGAVQGTFTQPVTIQAPPVINNQAIALASGWTWFSLNMTPDNSTVGTVLSGIAGTPGDVVKSQTDFSLFDTDFGWVGTLTDLNPGPAYLINLKQSNDLVLSGTVVDPQTTPIALVPGWNWIGYLPQKSTDLNSALASLASTSTDGDLIKSQFAFAQFVNSLGWIGSLTTMDPGLGYQINVANAGTLTYPTVNAPGIPGTLAGNTNPGLPGTRSSDKTTFGKRSGIGLKERPGLSEKKEGIHEARDGKAKLEASEHHAAGPAGYRGSGWQPDPTAYPASMTYTAEIEHDGSVWRNPNVEVGFFSGDELRGTGHIEYVPGLKKYLAFAMIHGAEEEEDLAVRVYDAEADREVDLGRLHYAPGTALGTPVKPVRLTVTSAPAAAAADLPDHYALDAAYPNPFRTTAKIRYALPENTHVVLEVYDVLGRRVKRLVDGDQKAGRYEQRLKGRDMAAGVYFYRIKAGSFSKTHKLVLLK